MCPPITGRIRKIITPSSLIFPDHCPKFLTTVEKSSWTCIFIQAIHREMKSTAFYTYLHSNFNQISWKLLPILPILMLKVKMRWNRAAFNCGEEFLNYRLPFQRRIRGWLHCVGHKIEGVLLLLFEGYTDELVHTHTYINVTQCSVIHIWWCIRNDVFHNVNN